MEKIYEIRSKGRVPFRVYFKTKIRMFKKIDMHKHINGLNDFFGFSNLDVFLLAF